ncbi:hypothetical protein [Chitinolyticbacter albus]|uniref:hypothetical protein n=1 Tax=Chitinolyticbacter albus TaxID=2961951 RepID=UPI00210EF785|nr:hypothetical protein [Chitinolyticbacter albus]
MSLRTYLPTWIGCVLVTSIGSQRNFGFFVFLLGLLLLLAMPVALWRLCLRPALRKSTLIGAAMWLTSLAAISGAQWYHQKVARQQADEVVQFVTRYRQQHGQYPDPEQGLAPLRVARERGVRYWLKNDGQPLLFYHSTLTGFDKYHYDFTTQRWVFLPD